MTTTTGTTSTSTTQQLLTSLGTGSGLDTANLVTSLVAAQFSAKTGALTAKAETLTKQISGVATLKSTVTAFSAALESLVKGGTLQTQPTVSDASVLTAAAIPGKAMSGTQSSVTVTRLASAQGAASAAIVDKNGAPLTSATTPLSTGLSRVVLTLGTATYAADGAIKVVGTDGKDIATAKVEFAAAAEPALAPANTGLVVLPLPLRAKHIVYTAIGLDPNYNFNDGPNMCWEYLSDDARLVAGTALDGRANPAQPAIPIIWRCR